MEARDNNPSSYGNNRTAEVFGPEGGGQPRGRMLPNLQPPIATLSGHRATVKRVCAHPKLNLVVSCSEDSSIKVWDSETGMFDATLTGHTKAVNHIAFNPLGDRLVSCSADLTIKLWNFEPGKDRQCLKTLNGHEHTVSCVEFVGSGDKVVSCSRDATIKIWEINTGYCLQNLLGHNDWVRSLAVSPDGLYLASGGNDQVVMIWNLNDWQILHELRGHTHYIQTVAFCNALAPRHAGAESVTDGSLGLDNQRLLGSPPLSADVCELLDPAIVPCSFLVASGARDNSVCIWDIIAGHLLFVVRDHSNWVNDLQFHPSGRYLLSASDDKSIKVTDVAKQRCLRTLDEAHEHFVTCISLAPHQGKLFSGGVDMEVRIWDCR